MFLGAVTHWETSLHGMELVPSLDFCRGQRHRHTMTNAVEGDLLDAGQNVMQEGVDEGSPSVDGIHGRVHH